MCEFFVWSREVVTSLRIELCSGTYAIYDRLPYLILQVRIGVEVGVGRVYDETRTIWRVRGLWSPVCWCTCT